MTGDYSPLREYGLIGNLETCALISRNGSIDWCCFPRLESPSVFAAILDADKGGRFVLRPADVTETHHSYLDQTNVLETTFRTESGVVKLTDFMPVRREREEGTEHRSIFRKLTCEDGTVTVTMTFRPRFDYARAVPTLERTDAGVVARTDGEQLFLQSPCELELHDDQATGTMHLEKGQRCWFVVRYGMTEPISRDSCDEFLNRTVKYWTNWVHRCEAGNCDYEGPWHDMVVRSTLALKLLTNPVTGAIAAAPTTSLPEWIGGERNWDYRYVWLRDASFTVEALHTMGHVSEARDYFKWLRSISGVRDPEAIRVMYTLRGELVPPEQELPHLEGYRGSRPVRIGNAARDQHQLDIYGELVNAFFEIFWNRKDARVEDWEFFEGIVDYVCHVWQEPDAGIWEIRGPNRHFTYSKLMCWVALDRAIKVVETHQLDAPIDWWYRNRSEIREAILSRGFSEKRNSFIQAFGSDALDATSLLIPILGFLPPDDPRVQGTIDATIEHLMEDGFVRRYVIDDGIPGREGTFILSTLWLAYALALAGRHEEALDVFQNVVDCAGPLGLLSEEIDPRTNTFLGNYPQAYSHIGLIDTARVLTRTGAAPG